MLYFLYGSCWRNLGNIERVFFINLVNLRKAYDSVPREAMWKDLKKLGVPEVMVSII